jgi:hypothetical protein
MGNISDKMCRGFKNARVKRNKFLNKFVSCLENVEKCGATGHDHNTTYSL